MAAYVVSEVTVVDEEGAAVYRELAAESIALYGGRYLSRGQRPEAVEGDCAPQARLIVLEFPDLATAHRWYASPEYAAALEVRKTALERRVLFVDGAVHTD